MYRYISVSEELSSPYLGRYHSFGIAAQREAAGHWQVVCKVSDVSTDPVFVENLAARCTARPAGAGPPDGYHRGCADLRVQAARTAPCGAGIFLFFRRVI